MKQLIFALLAFVSFTTIKSQVLGFNYAKSLKSTSVINPYDMKVDSVNNFIYITGNFYGNTDFDFSPAVYTMTTAVNSIPSIYIAKYTLNGLLVWAKSIGNNKTNIPNKLNFDANNNVYLVGEFMGVLDFDPSAATATISATSTSLPDGFILKLDLNGNYVWAKTITGPQSKTISDVELDVNNNLFLSGSFTGVTDFDPSPTTYTLNGSAGGMSYSGFIAKYNTAGNFIFVKQLEAITSAGLVTVPDIILTKADVYATGVFDGVVDFDPSTATSTLSCSGDYYGYIAKYDSLGIIQWVQSLTNNSTGVCAPKALRYNNNKIYVSGNFNGIVDFDGAAATYTLNSGTTTTGVYNVFTTCYNTAGYFLWANSFGGFGKIAECVDMTINPNSGKIAITGAFNSLNGDFDPGIATHTLSTNGNYDMYINVLDSMGNFGFVSQVGSANNDAGYKVAWVGNSIFNYGFYTGVADFDVNAGTFTMSPSGINSAVYLARYDIVNLPNANFSISQSTLCQNSSINFTDNTSNTPNSWSWSFPGGAPSTSTSQNPVVTYTSSGTYTVTLMAANASGTSTPVSQTITVNMGPTVVVSNITVCAGQTATLSASGASSYSWNTGATTASIFVTPTITTNYTVTGTTNGCSNSSTSNVTVNQLPIVSCALTSSIVCVNNTTVGLSGTPTGGVFNGTGVTGNSFDPFVAGAGTYTINYSYSDANTCSNTDSKVITVDLCTGITELNNNSFVIYPNPTTGSFSIGFNKSINNQIEIEVYDAIGKLVLTQKMVQNHTIVSFDQFAKGIYFVKINIGNDFLVKKIVKE